MRCAARLGRAPEVRQEDAEQLEAEVLALVGRRLEQVALRHRLPQRFELPWPRRARRPGLVRVGPRLLQTLHDHLSHIMLSVLKTSDALVAC